MLHAQTDCGPGTPPPPYTMWGALAQEQKGHEHPERRTQRKTEYNTPDRAVYSRNVGTHGTVIMLMHRI